MLVMECFSALVKTVEDRGLFLPLGMSAIKHRISLYADDVVIFVSSVDTDLILIKAILDLFFRATGLVANFVKIQAFPIHCDARHTDMVAEVLGCAVASFPCTYLGVPLSLGRLPRAAMQPLIDKVANQIPTWKGRLLNRSSRLILVQSTLYASQCIFPWHSRSRHGR
jgi:hypothetical protein